MKNLIKYLASFLLVVSLFATTLSTSFSTEVLATDFDANAKGSIEIDYRYEGSPLKDIKFNMYHISKLEGKNKHTILPKYSDFDMDFDMLVEEDYFSNTRDNLENYISYNMISPEKTFHTDNSGKYKLENLELGLYFIQAEVANQNGLEIFSEPLFICVGQFNYKDNEWMYDYTVQPKISVLGNESYNITVKKIWKNTNSDLLIPKEIEIELQRNGVKYDVVSLNEANKWSYTWYDINPSDSWSIKELTKLKDFKVSYEKDVLEFTVTNTYTGKDDEQLPQTGTHAYLIPMFASLGLVLILVGVLLRYKIRYKKDDKKNFK